MHYAWLAAHSFVCAMVRCTVSQHDADREKLVTPTAQAPCTPDAGYVLV